MRAVFISCLVLVTIFVMCFTKVIRDPPEPDDTDYCKDALKCDDEINYACNHHVQDKFTVTDLFTGKMKECAGSVQISSVERGIIQMKVNDFRNQVAAGSAGLPFGGSNMRYMTWDYKLEHFAQILGTNDFSGLSVNAPYPTFKLCAKTKELTTAGAFLYEDSIPPIEKPDFDELIKVFAVIKPEEDLILRFAYPDPIKPGAVQLKYVWTMLAWAEATRIGCAYANHTCKTSGEPDAESKFLFCFLGSGVNTVGNPVFQQGKACTTCPSGTSCDNESRWLNLCAPTTGTTSVLRANSVIPLTLLTIVIQRNIPL